MSKYGIYRADFADPGKARKRNKWIYSLFILLLFSLTQVPAYSQMLKTARIQVIIITFLIIGAVLMFLFLRLRGMSNSLKKIGTLEFSRKHLTKTIGDLTDSYSFDDISKLELEDYFKDVTVSLRRPGLVTKLLKITFKNFSEETIILSGKSIDYRQKIHLADSLKTLKKITSVEIIIKQT